MTFRTALTVLLMSAALLSAACGGSEPSEPSEQSGDAGQAEGGGKTITIALEAQNESGESGTATLTAEGPRTRIVLELENPASDSPQPAHVHKGTCSDLDPAPAYPLANVTAGTSETVVDVPLEELEGARFAVNVHKSEAEAEVYVACGTVGADAREEEEDQGGPGYGY
jgi:hypothetical protein